MKNKSMIAEAAALVAHSLRPDVKVKDSDFETLIDKYDHGGDFASTVDEILSGMGIQVIGRQGKDLLILKNINDEEHIPFFLMRENEPDVTIPRKTEKGKLDRARLMLTIMHICSWFFPKGEELEKNTLSNSGSIQEIASSFSLRIKSKINDGAECYKIMEDVPESSEKTGRGKYNTILGLVDTALKLMENCGLVNSRMDIDGVTKYGCTKKLQMELCHADFDWMIDGRKQW